MAIEVPVKLYLEKLLKECRNVSVDLALLPGPVKSKALHAVADRMATDQGTFSRKTPKMSRLWESPLRRRI